ncbi:hypothetical protein BDP27DRAFT_1289578 [Rhodocollybia butyracea]|uniref:WD40 repeat-like protein n=1 Tax=Rhodocollybia butyracea TaxID=206335 RepID=A0A9P5UAH7_9AGAR|nr:hypothetical protein BDP27DRAFT_1289578 [Rhodocollybia butyracea]
MRVWDAESGKPVGNPLKSHTGIVSSVAFSPDGRRIVSGSSDKSVRVWDAETLTKPLPPKFPSMLQTFCSHPDQYLPYLQNPFSSAHLSNEGWIYASNSLLLWIPLHCQQTLLLPPLQLVISNAEIITLDIQNFVHGFNLVTCYHKPTL